MERNLEIRNLIFLKEVFQISTAACEIEAQVENLNLSKAKAESEARRSKLEAETLQSLLSLRQDDPVLLPKPKPKGKMK